MQSFTRWPITLFLFILAINASGCTHKASGPMASGFLNNYVAFNEVKNDKGMFIYELTEGLPANYSKVLIAPVTIHFHDDAKGIKIKEEKLQKLTSYFEEALLTTLGENFTIVDIPGPEVLIVRVAMTEIIPNKVLLNLHWSTTLAGWGIGGASMEAEVVDALTNQRVLGIIDQRKGNRAKYHKGLTKWGHTKEVIEFWAGLINERLDIVL